MALATVAQRWDMLPGTLPLPDTLTTSTARWAMFPGTLNLPSLTVVVVVPGPGGVIPLVPLTLGDLLTRVRMLLQDPDATAWQTAQISREVHHSLLGCARAGQAHTLLWVQALQHKTHYPLNAQALHQYSGRDSSGTTGNPTTLTVPAPALAAADIVAGDVVRNLTDGSHGVVFSVGAGIVTMAQGLTGGTTNSFSHGDVVVIERRLSERLVVQVHAVLYNGLELWPMTQEQLDRLTPGWERHATGPKYWSVDQQETPTVVQVHPAPLLTGSSIPTFPMNPLAMPWQENLVCVISEMPQETNDPEEVFHWLDWYADLVVFETASRLAGFPGEWQALSVSQGAGAVAELLRQRGGA
jgi:hypothetical protein